MEKSEQIEHQLGGKKMLFNESTWKKIGCFAGGVLFGTAGLKVLGSKDARNVYTKALAAGLRAKDCVMTTSTKVQERAEDILAEAQAINEKRAAEEAAEENGEEVVETAETEA